MLSGQSNCLDGTNVQGGSDGALIDSGAYAGHGS